MAINLQEEFVGVVARAVTEPVEVSKVCVGGTRRLGLARRGGRRRADDHWECRSVEGLFESLLAEAF